MSRQILVLILLLLLVACVEEPVGRFNVPQPCNEIDGAGIEVVRDLSDIGWCTVHGGILTAKFGTRSADMEPDNSWSIPEPVEEPIILDDISARSIMTDPFRDRQWGLDKINIKRAWLDNRGEQVKVWIIDTGYDLDHPDLPMPANCIKL